MSETRDLIVSFNWFKIIRTFVWLSVVVVCCYFMLHQLTQCLNKLSNPPIITQTKIIDYEYMPYPALTFCYKNSDNQGYDLRVLWEEFGIEGYWTDLRQGRYSDLPWKNFPFGEVDVTQVWENATYDFVNLKVATGPQNYSVNTNKSRIVVVSASLNQKSNLYQGIVTSTRFFHDHGLCYLIHPPTDADKPPPGEKNGYKMFFLLQQGDTDHTSRLYPGGFDIFIHDETQWWTENPQLSHRGQMYHVETGKMVSIQISHTIYHTLSREKSICTNERTIDNTSYPECLEKCRWRRITAEIPCLTPFMDTGEDLPTCQDQERFLDSTDRYRRWTERGSREACMRDCIPDCLLKLYKAQVSKKAPIRAGYMPELEVPPEAQAQVFIYYESGFSEQLKETWGYDMTLFIADFGGSLGFLLGVSFLSLIEIVEGISIVCYNIYQEKKIQKLREGSKRRRETLLKKKEEKAKF